MLEQRTEKFFDFFEKIIKPKRPFRDYMGVRTRDGRPIQLVPTQPRQNNMKKDELLNYFDDLTGLARSKCTSDTDAEDLVSDTLVAALTYLERGGEILYPKTWLANTLMHKYNSALRKKYGSPEIIYCDIFSEMSDFSKISDPTNALDMIYETDEEAELRREVAYLTRINREAVIRYYFVGESVSQIATSLGVPEGTIKSRLFAGRKQIRKGLDKMAKQTHSVANDYITNTIPAKLHINNSGECGPNMEPMSLVEGNLIAQNILINAYERPLTAVEIARSLGIPTAYIEPTIDKLVDGELMVKTEGDRYYTDCIVFKPEDSLTRFDAQLKFVDDNIESFWKILNKMLDRISKLEFCKIFNHRQLKKLERYAIQCAVQDFIADGAQELYIINTEYPKRKDGGRWIAQANMFPADFDDSKMNLYNEYAYVGGHRSCGRDEEYMGSHGLAMFEFETAFKDCGNAKWGMVGFRKYIGYMRKLMWCIYKGIPLDTAGTNIPADMIERLPKYEEYGILLHECGSWKVDIPTLSSDEYRSYLIPIIDEAKDALISEIGENYVEFLRGTKIILPEHLKGSPNVPDYRLYVCSNKCILMAVVRELAEKKLFLHDVDYCCPAMVFIYDE